MRINPATLHDASQINTLLADLNYPQEALGFQKRFEHYLNTPEYYILVAREGDTILGLVAFTVTQFFMKDPKRCYIEALVVHHGYRRQGIGRALMHEAEQRVRALGATIIELTSSVYREKETGTHSFYRSLGYTKDVESDPPHVYFIKQLH